MKAGVYAQLRMHTAIDERERECVYACVRIPTELSDAPVRLCACVQRTAMDWTGR